MTSRGRLPERTPRDQPWPAQGVPGHPIVHTGVDPCTEVDVGISCTGYLSSTV